MHRNAKLFVGSLKYFESRPKSKPVQSLSSVFLITEFLVKVMNVCSPRNKKTKQNKSKVKLINFLENLALD